MKSRGLWPGSERGPATRDDAPTHQHETIHARMEPKDGEDKERARFRRAQAILYRAQKDNDDDAKREANTAKLAQYFNGRGIEPPPGALLLSARSARELDLARAFPAVVLPITDVESKIRGVHVTFLNRDCTAKLATVDRQKQTFGLVKGGFIVLRAPQPDAPLVVGEGIESALSAAKMAGDLPAIAAISAANMPALPAVPACSEVIVAGDRDESMRLRSEGRAVILLHHEGKGGSPRGSSKREDVLDTIIKIKELKDDDLDDDDAARIKTRFEISYPKHRDFFGKEAEPVIATLDTASGATVWTHEPYRSNQMALVDALLKANTKQKDIATQLKLSPARVSQIVKKIHEKRLKANQERDAKARDRDDDDEV